MTSLRFTAALGLAALALTAPPALAAGPNDILPEAPAKAVIVRACTSCHQAPQIVIKPHTDEEWNALIGIMMDRGAKLSEPEQDQVLDYLVKYFGPKAATAPAAAPAK
jgi:hypothetical protein